MKIFGTHDEKTIGQLVRCVAAEEGAIGVLCADGHLGYSMPIGGVVGYKNFISPSGVGYDIACGNYAVRTNIRFADIGAEERQRVADEIQKRISFGVGRKNDEPIGDHEVFERIASSPVVEQRKLLRLAMDQLGTVGSGNHYVDVLEDSDGLLWVAVHFGSRGFGHKTASGFMNIASGRAFDERSHDGEMEAPPLLLNVVEQSGQDYIAAMEIAGEYAYAGRELVVQKVLEILGAANNVTEAVHNHHNFAWRETHGGSDYWVVRKGATPAFPGQRGFIGGSMGDMCVIVEGRDSKESREALHSTVHGAGRIMSRRKAAGKTRIVSRWKCKNYRNCDYSAAKGGYFKEENGPSPKCPKCGHKLQLQQMQERLSDGLINYGEELQKLKKDAIVIRGGGPDEAPPVYRQLKDVLEAHQNTIEIVHVMWPRIVVMAGMDEYDPYKD